MPSYPQHVLAVLVGDRQHAIRRDLASARRFRLRRSVAAAFHSLAGALDACGAAFDDEPGTGDVATATSR
ncbi:MAG: hypothetical protein QOI11_1466 [Candidatus Eremiobacteraeota bacterium]|nr:hypothetical protein [Candidatus Eremiobacteraeota bacterium]